MSYFLIWQTTALRLPYIGSCSNVTALNATDLFFIYIGVNKAGHGAFKSKKAPQIPVKFNMAHSLFIKWLFLLQNIIDIVILWALHVYNWNVQLYLVNTPWD